MGDLQINNGHAPRKRPGPFGPAWALLPKDQQPLLLNGATPAGSALERMVDNGFSQIPVTDKAGRIIGVFSWKSFGKRVADLHATTIKPTDLPIRAAMEPARFIDREVYIDTETDWGDIDHVLVGTDEELVGVLCISDVFGRLNDFAEAFVLLYEIEHEIRDLIRDVYDDGELRAVLEAMKASASRPAMEVVAELKQVIEEQGTIPAVGKAIKLLRSGSDGRLENLEDFSFSQYRSLICCEANWPRFEPVFDTMRELVTADFGDVNELRNVVFHFRRGITPKDTDRLRRFRDRLRYDRELYARERNAPASATTTS
ncbi:MAG: CBS domain-containing protein [Pirellulales bacterium]